ncbi:cell wall anchored protein [Paecilomyces variotii No. 5]|uniref:Cell wall anchored protein n=1 Tax=Byssochlamys spectabilis (strain No. 5 / NBRC 109023) TaxID=1356009 RepID=V5G6T8_BYSSN|nr:cell wall anchored protein [Paecilomyces variotii No. 5]
MWSLLPAVLFALIPAALGDTSGIDPIANFCKRVYHQSTLKNGTIYIDGGTEVFVANNNQGAPEGVETIGYNTYLLEVDMSTSWDWKSNISIVKVDKTANPQTGTFPPVVGHAALYRGGDSDNNIYLYGGTVDFTNTTFPGWQYPTSNQYSLWSYDTVAKTWNQYDVSLNAPERPASGAYAEAPELSLAFWLNGEIDTGSDNNLALKPGFERYLDGFVVIDTDKQTALNVSTATLDRTPRIGGGLAYVPGVGPKGIVVAIGGTTRSVSESSNSSSATYLSMGTVDLIDVASIDDSQQNGTWYSQQTTGDIPDPRIEFCLVAMEAPDKSSHNIYLYGGRNGEQIFDQIYILSLPSFTWTKVYEGQSPRFGHTCNMVGARQMITIGGSANADLLNGCDWETKSVAIYDLTALTWGSVYNAYAPKYEVPSLLYQVIGGSGNGSANFTAPVTGFNSSALAKLFQYTGPGVTDDSGSDEKSGISGGAIAGAVVGSIAGAALIAGLAVFLILRRRRATHSQQLDYGTNNAKDDNESSAIARNPDQRAELASNRALSELSSERHVHELALNPGSHKQAPDGEIAELDGSPARLSWKR